MTSATLHAEQPAQANMRHASDFSRARRHSTFVRSARLGLPVLAGCVVAAFALQAVWNWTPLGRIQALATAISDGKLVMEEPKLKGFDRNERPYDVTALRAIQDLSTPGIVELSTIAATLPMDATSFAKIGAGSGLFDQKAQTLKLFDKVLITGARGMDINLADADIDIESGALVSHKPVTVKSGETTIDAQSVKVSENGKRVTFNNRVKMTINKPIRRGTPPATR